MTAHKTETDCTFQVVEDSAGNRLLSLATFGSDDRKDRNTVSQSMQFDEATSRMLVDAILAVFPDLRRG